MWEMESPLPECMGKRVIIITHIRNKIKEIWTSKNVIIVQQKQALRIFVPAVSIIDACCL